MLSRESTWVWDSWYVVEQEQLHAFYLMAPKSLGDPALRHVNARVGHSVSNDGKTWTHLPDVLGPNTGETFDNQAIWTGSIIREGATWHLFYTGINRSTREALQSVGHAVSSDLNTWTRVSETPIVRADERYALLGNPHDGAEHFRDPWVFPHDGQWHMLVTASDAKGWGTIAHATSNDLGTWQLSDPLIVDSHIRQFEVTQTLCVDGQWMLLFCAQPSDIEREGLPRGYGMYCVPAKGPLGPFDLDRTELLAEGVYAGRVVWFDGRWTLWGFLGTGTEADFRGVISDPIPLALSERGTLERVTATRT